MADTTTVGRWLTRLDAVLVAGLAIIAIAPFGSLFVSSRVILLASGLVALCLLINLLVRRVPASIAVVLNLFAAGAYVIFVVYRVGTDDAQSLSDVWDGISGSWADLLTATVPAGTSPQLASLPVMLGWLAAEIGVMLSLRTRSPTAPIVSCIVAFGVALLFTGNQGLVSPVLVGSLVVLSLVVVLLRANLFAALGSSGGAGSSALGGTGAGFGMDVSRRSLPVGQMRLGAVVVAVVATGAVIAGPLLPITSKDARIDLHDRYDPPLDVTDALSPLATLRAGLNDTSGEPVFTVRFDEIPAGITIDRVRNVILDTYDGTVWGSDATFARAGTEIPEGEPVVVPTVQVIQRYELAELDSSFLPALDRPVRVSGSRLGFDRTSGMLIAGGTPEVGFTYDVTSDVPMVNESVARLAEPGNDPAFSRLSLPPPGGWPVEITQFASQFPTASNRFDLLSEIQNQLLSPAFGYNAKARPGHSLGVLIDFLTAPTGGDGVATARVGYAEQFAAAFAILARVEGMPSRVVVGYRVDPEAAAAGETITVLPQDVHAWAEVNLNGVGWVAFDPTNPTQREPVEPPQVPETTIAPPVTTTPATIPPTTVPNDDPSIANDDGSADEGSFPIAVLLVPLGILAVPALIVGAKTLMRRGRRNRGDPATRVVGAWLESRDRLVVSGQGVDRGATVKEASERVSAEVAPALTTLAPILDRALYAQAEPDDELVEAAWQAESILTKTVKDESAVGQRLKALINPRPLVDAVRRSRGN